VTGGSRGIGAATAFRLAGKGAAVALTYHTTSNSWAALVDRIKGLFGYRARE
jgi:NAD(P)-dependent dehydrogenase (short-subunit alcohol dehydrogenase family)